MTALRPTVLLVLHAHLPWVVGTREEGWLHEAVLDCYLPLLDVLERAPPGRLSLSVTPVLAAMLGHAPALQRARHFIEARRDAADGWHREAAERALESLARASLLERLRALARAGTIELLGSAITHGFLPLLATVPEAAVGQVELGVQAHARTFGARPLGFWLPECGYAPGLDRVLAAAGVRFTFVDSHALDGAALGTAAPVFLPSAVAAFGRDPLASEQVWSSKVGYPADPVYADFHHRLGGQRVLRVTGEGRPKERWEPKIALARARQHARHFLQAREAGPMLQVAPYDAELFGHWWLEGPAFLETVLGEGDRLSTPSQVLAARPTLEARELPFSSWGRAGTAEVWLGPRNAWVWPHLHRAAEALLTLEPAAADRALPSLLLAQASDWPFLIDAGTCEGFASEELERHLLAFRAGLAPEPNPFPWAQAAAYRGPSLARSGLRRAR